MKTTCKNRFIEYVRLLLNDTDKKIFSDDELTGLIAKYTDSRLTNTSVTAYSNKYCLNCCPCDNSDGITDLEIQSGTDPDGAYVLDEWASVIYFDPLDPANSGTAPVDGTSITVSYYEVELAELMAELCWIISNSMTKLLAIQSISGLSIDTSQLSDGYRKQQLRWKVIADNSNEEL